MAYYARPMGDYKTYGYGGDPGLLSSIWRGIKRVAPVVVGGLIGGIPGAMAGAGGVSGGQKPIPTLPAPPGTVGGAISFPGGITVSGARTPTMQPGQGRLPPYTATGPGVLPGGGRGGYGCPSGYHFAKDGSGRLVRNRRMNVSNPRALRRALRRTDGFVKLAKRALKGTGYAVRRA